MSIVGVFFGRERRGGGETVRVWEERVIGKLSMIEFFWRGGGRRHQNIAAMRE